MKKIPISEAKAISEKYGYEQVIILAQKESKTKKGWAEGWKTTYNKDRLKCKFLGKVAVILAYNFNILYFNKKVTEEYFKKVNDKSR